MSEKYCIPFYMCYFFQMVIITNLAQKKPTRLLVLRMKRIYGKIKQSDAHHGPYRLKASAVLTRHIPILSKS